MMHVLTAAEMKEVDRKTEELGIAGPILMENAGHRVVEFLDRRFGPLSSHRILILCGKGNNGGDGLVVARQLATRFFPQSLDVVLAEGPPSNIQSLLACGVTPHDRITPAMHAASIVVDALLGTGLMGPPREPYAGLIRDINEGFPAARVVAVDIPSGMASDTAETPWPHVRADHTVTFTAPKVGLALEPNASAVGELVVGHIGSPARLCQSALRLVEPDDFRPLFAPRAPMAHKGTFGHVLVIGGASGKTGAAAMTGIAALRAGAGLVTVASEAASLGPISAHAPELMTEELPAYSRIAELVRDKNVFAVGPGMGVDAERSAFLQRLIRDFQHPTVLDADALTNVAGKHLPGRANLVLTPHPGEMARLNGIPVAEIQRDRLTVARQFSAQHGVTVVLKGRNTLTASPDGTVWINPTGGPALATGGSGDILTGLIAGLLAQFPDAVVLAVIAAVWLHGRAGDLAAKDLGEKVVIATDVLRYLPKAMEECAYLHD